MSITTLVRYFVYVWAKQSWFSKIVVSIFDLHNFMLNGRGGGVREKKVIDVLQAVAQFSLEKCIPWRERMIMGLSL